MIYDEGFEATIDNLVFFAFSRYDMVKGHDGNKHNVSKCGETHRGWYRDTSRSQFGCYVATKVGKQDHKVSLLQIEPVEQPQVPSPNYDKPLLRSWHRRHVHRLNLLQRSWTARVYDRFVGKS